MIKAPPVLSMTRVSTRRERIESNATQRNQSIDDVYPSSIDGTERKKRRSMKMVGFGFWSENEKEIVIVSPRRVRSTSTKDARREIINQSIVDRFVIVARVVVSVVVREEQEAKQFIHSCNSGRKRRATHRRVRDAAPLTSRSTEESVSRARERPARSYRRVEGNTRR